MKDKPESKIDGDVFYVGVDVSKDKLAVFAGDLFEGEIENSRACMGRLVRGLRRKVGKGTVFRFALEETGFYSLDVHLALDRLGQGVCVLDPGSVRHYAIACKVMAKTDRIDAFLIAEYARFKRLGPSRVSPEASLSLSFLLNSPIINRINHIGILTIKNMTTKDTVIMVLNIYSSGIILYFQKLA